MANTAANNIQFNVKIINNQLTRYTVEMGSTLAARERIAAEARGMV